MSEVIAVMGPIDARKITKVYSGKQGCACGCKGKYTYAHATTKEDPSDVVNPKVVLDVVRKVSILGAKAYLDAPNFFDESLVFADKPDSDRTYTIYFKEY